MHLIVIGLFILTLYFVYGFLAAVGSTLFIILCAVVMAIRQAVTYPRRKREEAERLLEEKERDKVLNRLHYRNAMMQTFREDHPEDWVERFSRWELEEDQKQEASQP